MKCMILLCLLGVAILSARACETNEDCAAQCSDSEHGYHCDHHGQCHCHGGGKRQATCNEVECAESCAPNGSNCDHHGTCHCHGH